MTYKLVNNPAYEGQTPRLLEVECHDRTPFLTVRCDCGEDFHLHESQLSRVAVDAEIASRCPACDETNVFAPRFFHDAFQRMRDAGWIL